MSIVLPRTDKEGKFYVSYSQLSTWKKSKREYIRQYFFGEGFTGMPDYMDFGSKVGEALENNDFSMFSDKEASVLKSVPRYDEFEREIKLQFDGFYVLGFIDSNTAPEKGKNKKPFVRAICDYKTGDISKKIGDYQSDDYTQLDIYSAALEQEYGVLPEIVNVFLIDRKGNAFQNEKLKVGDEFVTIIRTVTPERVALVKEDIINTVNEISECYKLFLRLNGLM